MLSPSARPSFAARWLPNGEAVLLALIALEVAVFAFAGTNFLTTRNGFEIARLAAEVGLLAFGLTPVIKTGGIDLSVGSMMGLSAVVLGAAWHVAGLPVWLAALAAIAVGAAGGALNGWLVTRLRVPPLIVTLGTFSLFRGIAEASTGGYTSYTGFPPAFLALGQGYMFGWIPWQLPLVATVFVALWLWLHRTVDGREITALGFNAEGARYAGVRVEALVFRTYLLSGTCAALAGVIYVARLGQAKADAGLGAELTAIAAVVLGGTSIAGGRGTLHGSLLGLLALIVLQNGLRLSGQPGEVAGIFTGAILIAAIAFHLRWSKAAATPTPSAASSSPFSMKNSQVALIVAAILGAALLVAASNIFLARSLTAQLAGAPGAALARALPAGGGARPVIALTPKAKSDPYFVSCKEGADAAAAALGVDLLWDGPTDPDPARQNEIVEAWITKGVDVIAASANSPAALSTVLRKAQERGIKVITWDADVEPDARSFFVNQATAEGIGSTLADEGARLAGGRGSYAIITASLTDANQNEWIRHLRARMESAHPQMTLATIQPSDGQRDKALTQTRDVVRAYPDVKVIIAIAAPAVPGAAEALKQENRRDVKLTGLSVPSLNKSYMKDGWVQSIVLWNTVDLGYLTVAAAKAVHDGTLAPGSTRLETDRLGPIEIAGDQILLGKPFVFTPENIDQFDF